MKKAILFMALMCLVICSCKTRGEANETVSPIQASEDAFLTAVQDTSISVMEVLDLALVYADNLTPIAAYSEKREERFAAQEAASEAIQNTIVQLDPRVKNSDDRAAYEQIINAFSAIRNQWLAGSIDGSEKNIHILREIPFFSYQGTNKETQDFFYIDCAIPSEEHSEHQLIIRFPNAAQKEPCLLFYKYKDEDGKIGDADAGYDLGEFSHIDIEDAPHSKVCFCNEEVFALMLKYDAMVIMYTSDLPASESYNGHDSVLVRLEGFHAVYNQLTESL